jgi:thymidine phosphorylase
VGLSDVARIGQAVDGEAPLLRIHAASEEAARAVAGPLRAAFTLSDTEVTPPPLIHERIA